MARDIIHTPVKNALIKDGWTITHEPFQVEFEELEIQADLAIERDSLVAEKRGQKIVVEIKSFIGRSFIRDLEQAIGQYEVYLDFLDLAQLDYELYLAISEQVYQNFFTKKGTATLVKRHRLNLLVVDIPRQEVVTWMPGTTIDS